MKQTFSLRFRLYLQLLPSLIVMLASTALAQPTVYSVDVETDQLYTLDLATGDASPVGSGAVGFGKIEGLSIQPGTGVLYGLDTEAGVLITINTATGIGTLVGSLGTDMRDAGLAFADDGSLYAAADLGDDDGFYSVNPESGVATFIADEDSDAHALAFFGGVMYGILDSDDNLNTINVTTGVGTQIGLLGTNTDEEGFVIDSDGTGYLIMDDGGGVFTVDLTTGAATFFTDLSCGDCNFTGAAIVPAARPSVPVPALSLWQLSALSGLLGLMAWFGSRRIRPDRQF